MERRMNVRELRNVDKLWACYCDIEKRVAALERGVTPVPTGTPPPTPTPTPSPRDVDPPVLITAQPNDPRISGSVLTLNFQDAHTLHTTNEPGPNDFDVIVDGNRVQATQTVVDTTAKTIIINLELPVSNTATVRLNYTQPVNPIYAIQDELGNKTPSFRDQPVRNITPAPNPSPTPSPTASPTPTPSPRDINPPVLIRTNPNDPRINANEVFLNFQDANQLGTGTPLTSYFGVTFDTSSAAVRIAPVTAVTVDRAAKTIKLTLGIEATSNTRNIILAYNAPDASNPNAIADTLGNRTPSFSNITVRNITQEEGLFMDGTNIAPLSGTVTDDIIFT